jgi:hypothetical protein
LDRRLGGPQSQSVNNGEEKNFQPLLGLEPLVIQPVAQCYSDVCFKKYLGLPVNSLVHINTYRHTMNMVNTVFY